MSMLPTDWSVLRLPTLNNRSELIVPLTAELPSNTKTNLLEAALAVVRAKGYSATTVDDICQAAGVSKGAFFHHFKSKEELAIEAVRVSGTPRAACSRRGPYRAVPDRSTAS